MVISCFSVYSSTTVVTMINVRKNSAIRCSLFVLFFIPEVKDVKENKRMSKSWNLTCSTSIHPFSKLLFQKSTSTHQEHANRPFCRAKTQTTGLLVVRQQCYLLKHHTALLSVLCIMLKNNNNSVSAHSLVGGVLTYSAVVL